MVMTKLRVVGEIACSSQTAPIRAIPEKKTPVYATTYGHHPKGGRHDEEDELEEMLVLSDKSSMLDV